METKIKIVSNPYTRDIEFLRWNNGWLPIDSGSNPDSKLLEEKLIHGFFPFKAEEIVSIILSEYQTRDHPLAIVFEGSDDEYEELSSICSDDKHSSRIVLERSPKFLSNARDVLPEIISVFKSIQPLVDESVLERRKVARELNKFYDVSSDVIPLCVLGNYSAGKSTFINALIGHELLPNGDEPVTAKVFEIRRSKHRDRATIEFTYNDLPVNLRFGDDGLVPERTYEGVAPYDKILSATANCQPEMICHMNCVLKIINAPCFGNTKGTISDLVRIEVPFSTSDAWSQDREFVIFDTPGSNSASNEDHIRVLQEAMKGLSNGLPIFVAERTSLDSNDNQALYSEIQKIEAMDERFAMIVVNKADGADLPKGGFSAEEVQQIKDEAVPRNLYAQGIYFVSSILGLGAKTKGYFRSDNYAEKFEDQERKYTNPDSRFYKTLYRYNILPGQISRRTVRESEQCPDLLLANSGLFCIENEIGLFADRFSAYNKCNQSESLLEQIIQITHSEIEVTKKEREAEKEYKEAEFEDDKAALIEQLEEECFQSESNSCEHYAAYIDEHVDPKTWERSVEELQEREAQILDAQRDKLQFSSHEEDMRQAFSSIFDHLKEKVLEPGGKSPLELLRSAVDDFVDDAKDTGDKAIDFWEVFNDADRFTSNELLREVNEDFSRHLDEMADTLDGCSKSYWAKQAEDCRASLFQIATNSSALSEEKQREVGEIIIKYPSLKLAEGAEGVFIKSDFQFELRIWNRIIFSAEKLKLKKLSEQFNERILQHFEETRNSIDQSHSGSFSRWLDELLGAIEVKIADYNPVLQGHVRSINELAEIIGDLTHKLNQLDSCRQHVSRVIGWRE